MLQTVGAVASLAALIGGDTSLHRCVERTSSPDMSLRSTAVTLTNAGCIAAVERCPLSLASRCAVKMCDAEATRDPAPPAAPTPKIDGEDRCAPAHM